MKSRILSICLALFSVFPLCIFSVAGESPAVSAQAAILLECESGQVVYEKSSQTRLPMASTTKIMTALVAIESADLSMAVSIPTEAVGVEGSSVYLTAGETLTMEELLYAMMLESANDAAAAIACTIGGSIDSFAALMNEKAAALGLKDTHFTNPHGLDNPEHYTTAADLARLTAYALKNPTFAAIVSTYKKTIPLKDGEGTRLLLNHNRMLKQWEDVIGVKTGFTKHSGRCLVSAARQNGVQMVAVTLNAPDDWQDHRSLLNYGFSQYEAVTLALPGDFAVELPCVSAPDGIITATNTEELTIVLPAGTEVTHVMESRRLHFPPIAAGDVVGCVRFFAGDQLLGELPLTACCDVTLPARKPSLIERLLDF